MTWTVADVMTTSVVTVEPQTDFKTCVRKMSAHQVSALPVVDYDRRLVGVVSESDLLAKERERDLGPTLWNRVSGDVQAEGRTAAEVMTSPAICVSPTASIPEAARLMYREAVKRLPVVNEAGFLVGIVSRADLLKTFTRSDESIWRDIVDNVVKGALMIDPKSVKVEVVNGLVRLSGKLESKSLCRMLVRMVERVEGTVGVDSRLTFLFDDSHLKVEQPAQALHYTADQR
jgi:CBS-domain-containing membrane protein